VFGPSSLLPRFGALRCLRLVIGPLDALEEERDRHVERLAQFIEAAGADTVFGLLVFVELLVGDA